MLKEDDYCLFFFDMEPNVYHLGIFLEFITEDSSAHYNSLVCVQKFLSPLTSESIHHFNIGSNYSFRYEELIPIDKDIKIIKLL